MMRPDQKLVVKGIMCQDDGISAVQSGADAIWVSNGSHENDGTTLTAVEVLESIATALKGSGV